MRQRKRAPLTGYRRYYPEIPRKKRKNSLKTRLTFERNNYGGKARYRVMVFLSARAGFASALAG